MDEMQKLMQAMNELLSEYGVDRSGIDAAIELATDFGGTEYDKGWKDSEVFHHLPTD